MKGKIALITGASRGIGAAVAKRFAAEGAQIILVARSSEGLEKVDDAIRESGGNASLAPLDVTDAEALHTLAKQIAARFGKLDILVGNAAILGELAPIAHTDAKLWEKVFAVNLHANLNLIQAMDPVLQQSTAPRALFVTSSVGSTPRAYWGAYAASKAALEMMARLYAAENQNIKVELINPGGVATHMRAQAFPGEDAASLSTPESVTDRFVAACR